MPRSKYGAVRTEIDGIVFPSKREANRYSELKLLENNGDIEDLKLQYPYPIVVNGIKVAVYKADFVYRERGRTITEDVKGMRTPVYRLKKKLVEALHGIEIVEV